jgi:hypothetical protein
MNKSNIWVNSTEGEIDLRIAVVFILNSISQQAVLLS